jgi:hypothetical protein
MSPEELATNVQKLRARLPITHELEVALIRRGNKTFDRELAQFPEGALARLVLRAWGTGLLRLRIPKGLDNIYLVDAQ